MQEQISKLRNRLLEQIKAIGSSQEIQQLRVHALGKKGELTQILKQMGSLEPDERPKVGQLANEAKASIEEAIVSRLEEIQSQELNRKIEGEAIDVTLPGRKIEKGSPNPLTRTTELILDIFYGMGFSAVLGPDIETDFYNFQALNIPEDHPARDMQDTFWMEKGYVLRTHTSPVQIRTMEKQKPPLRITAPGAVYRCDSDMTHSPMFHQVEGLLVDENISFGDLKGILIAFLQELFGKKTEVRFRPSFFPFTEPSAEVDIRCNLFGKDGASWMEILGAGSVDPEVFKAVGYPEDSMGFAFGIGVERVAMLLYGIDHIRHFYRNDLRFLEQF